MFDKKEHCRSVPVCRMVALQIPSWATRTACPLGLETAAILFGHNRGSPSVDFFYVLNHQHAKSSIDVRVDD